MLIIVCLCILLYIFLYYIHLYINISTCVYVCVKGCVIVRVFVNHQVCEKGVCHYMRVSFCVNKNYKFNESSHSEILILLKFFNKEFNKRKHGRILLTADITWYSDLIMKKRVFEIRTWAFSWYEKLLQYVCLENFQNFPEENSNVDEIMWQKKGSRAEIYDLLVRLSRRKAASRAATFGSAAEPIRGLCVTGTSA